MVNNFFLFTQTRENKQEAGAVNMMDVCANHATMQPFGQELSLVEIRRMSWICACLRTAMEI